MFGWTGKLLEVDLSTGKHRVEEIPAETLERWIGGKGLAGHYLGPWAQLSWDDPAMPILFFCGPLVGTRAPTSGRMTVMTRSPLTGTVGDASVGGDLATQIKRAGYDGIAIRGQSREWVGLTVSDDQVSLVPARDLVGLSVPQAAARLDERCSSALIGPAAENGVRFSSLIVDRHFAAARNGIGLAFAKKRLKYVAVRGSGKVAVKEPARLDQAREKIFRQIAASPILLGEQGIHNYGTPALYDLMHARRMMPTANFAQTYFAPAPKLNAQALAQQFRPKRSGCRGCHILCKKSAASGGELPEFETLSHFTALVGNSDLIAAVQANRVCNELGLDTISAAATLACYQEISGDQLEPARLLALLDEIGRGQGELGLALGQGSRRYAEQCGRPELSISVKGQELPAYDPRGAYGMALAYATSTRGGCHLRAYPISHEILRKPVATDRFSFEGKARMIKIAEDHNAAVDSLTACKFVFFASSLEEYAEAYSAVTGLETTATDLSRAGERIYYHERMLNAKNGFGADDDDLPPRFFSQPGSAGPGLPVPPISRKEFLAARTRYYRVRGLDEQGRPKADKAAELGLPWND